MKKATVIKIIVAIAVPTVIAGTYFGIQYYRKKKNATTKKEFDDLISAFAQTNKDIFAGIDPKIYDKALANFIKNINKKEALELMDIGAKKEAERTVDEKVKLLNYLTKILGATNVSALKG